MTKREFSDGYHVETRRQHRAAETDRSGHAATLNRVSYDHILLPSGAAVTPDEIDAYLSGQEGLDESAAIAEIAAAVNARNAELPEQDTFLSVSPAGGAATGDTLYISSPYDAIGFVRDLLFELATPRGYAVYDPQLSWLVDPAGHVPVQITHGGAGTFPYLTRDLADRWVAGLTAPNPYLIAERGDQDYIQTYRDPEGVYTLEYRAGSAERHFGTTLTDPSEVSRIIWAWTTGDTEAVAGVGWAPVTF